MRLKRKAFDRLSAWNSENIKDTIVVVGAPRSGTTWLAELLRELPRYKLINEPLRLSTQPAARAAGFDWRTHVAPHKERPEMSQYLSDVLRGDVELGPAWHFRSENTFAKLWEHMTHDRVIVKFCRAGRMLHWMTQQFDARGIVVIIRHPCAVIASMLNMGDNWQPRDIQKKAVLKHLKRLS